MSDAVARLDAWVNNDGRVFPAAIGIALGLVLLILVGLPPATVLMLMVVGTVIGGAVGLYRVYGQAPTGSKRSAAEKPAPQGNHPSPEVMQPPMPSGLRPHAEDSIASSSHDAGPTPLEGERPIVASEASSPSKDCHACGAPIDAGAAFCPRCGVPQPAASSPAAGPPAPVAPTRTEPAVTPGPPVGAAIGLVGAALVLGGALMPWVTVDYWSGDAFRYNYGEGVAGPILLACAAVIGLASLIRLSSQVSGGGARLAVIAATAVAALCAGVVWNELTRRVAVPIEYMFDVSTYRALFNGLGGGHVGPGPLIAAAGAIVAFVGGLLRR